MKRRTESGIVKPLRVLHLGKYFPPFSGGIENFMADLMTASRGLGVAVAAIVHDHGAQLDVEPGFPVWRVPTHGELVHAPLSPSFRSHLLRVFRAWQPDLLHVHMPNTSAFWLLTLAELNIPFVVHWHADVLTPGVRPALRFAYRAYRPLEAALLRRAAAVIVTSPSYLDASTALASWRAKCEVIPLGLSSHRVSEPQETLPSTTAWRSTGALRVLAVGRLSRYKGFDHLIRAVSDLQGVELVILGEGEQGQALRELIVQRHAADRIAMPGRVDDPTRNRLLRQCDLLCLPSINRGEAFGLVLLEAMALGKPALVTRVPGSGMPWVVDAGHTGWHVEPEDPVGLARQLAEIRDHRDTLAPMGRQAQRQFEERFSIAAVAARTVSLYRRVIECHVPA
jgi:rhamnosyl/mannosyltransferase